jgi:hypothetical protein
MAACRSAVVRGKNGFLKKDPDIDYTVMSDEEWEEEPEGENLSVSPNAHLWRFHKIDVPPANPSRQLQGHALGLLWPGCFIETSL